MRMRLMREEIVVDVGAVGVCVCNVEEKNGGVGKEGVESL
jgi:hypothetical protein